MIEVACSWQLSHELGLCKNRKHPRNVKDVVRRGQLNLYDANLSSKTSQLDALGFRLLDSVNRTNCSLPSRSNLLLCQASILPIRGGEIPILKTATAALTRSCNAFQGNPFVLQLVPGFIIIVFAVWGLVPLMRHGRNLFLKQRGDNSWKRSGTHYVTTSYLRPLLLWAGATLVCRAFDPVVLSSEASQFVKKRLLVFARSISTVLAFAYCLSSLIQRVQQFLMETNDPNDTTNVGFQFAGKAVYSAVWVAAVSLFMELLGFSTQKMLTAGGLGTVLLTLAGREIFTNFLSSLMIHATRPFVLNEWIQTKIEGYEVSGTVEHVGWWSPTIIRGDDREAIHIPNHKFTVNVVRNLSQKTHWRIKTHFAVSHLDVNKINHIVADMRKVLAKNPQVEHKRLHRRVFLERIDPDNQALVILVSCFVKTSHIEEHMCVKEAILLDLLRVISHHRARLATPIRTVQKMQSDEDMENIPFFESVFTRARETTNRPFLLIEPPYKINGGDKTKPHIHSERANEGQDTRVASNLKDESSTGTQPTLKTDTQVDEFDDTNVATTSSPLKSKGDSKSAETSLDAKWRNSQPMVNNKVAATSLDSHKVVASSPKSKVDSEFAASAMNYGSTDNRQNNEVEGLDPVVLNSRNDSHLEAALKNTQVPLSDHGSGEVQDHHLATSQVEKETEKIPNPPTPQTRPTMEDNIVLEVALEGSKLTLPIEEGDNPPAEMKELTACSNGGASSSSAAKDKNTHTTTGDQ